MKQYAFTQLDGPDLPATDHFKPGNLLGQIRFYFWGVSRLVTQQPVEDQVRQGPILGASGKMGVQVAHLTHMDSEPKRVSGFMRTDVCECMRGHLGQWPNK